MTKNELLTELRAFETKLRSAEMQSFFASKKQETRDRFVSLRGEVSVAINKLSNAQLQEIANKLDELSGDLEAGIANLKDKIEKLNNATIVLNKLSTVLGLVARIVALVA